MTGPDTQVRLMMQRMGLQATARATASSPDPA